MSNYSSNFPTQRPSLNLVFNGGSDQLDSRISYTRSSTGTYLSNEKALNSENLLKQSQDFDTSWSRIHLVSSVSGGHSAPDGSSTGWLMTANTGTSQEPQLQQLFAVNSNTEYTALAHLKAGTASHGYVSFRGGSGGHYAYAIIDFSAGTVADGGSGFTGISSSITALSDSWYKVTVTATSDSTTSSPYCFIGISDGSAFGSNGTAPYDSNGETMYAWGAQLSSTNSKVYDSPTTTQISRKYSPLLKTAAANAPRFEYASDGQSVGTPKGLLVESQASNLARYGSDVPSWAAKTNVTVTANAAIAPSGELDADLFVASSTPGDHYVYDNAPTITSGTVYTASVYAKNAGQRYVQFVGASNVFGVSQYATFDLQTGSVDANGVTASAESVGNGWWRIQTTMTATLSGSGSAFLALANSATAARSPSFTGDDYSGVLIWGFQLETGSSASSLVDTGTGGSTATRAADSCSVATSSFYTGGDVSVVSELAGGSGSYPEVWELRDTVSKAGGVNDYILALKYSASADSLTDWRTWISESGNLTQTTISSSSTATKLGVSVDSNSVASCADGGTIYNSTSTVIPDSLDTLYIGRAYSSTVSLNGHIKRLALYNVALSDTELQALTS